MPDTNAPSEVFDLAMLDTYTRAQSGAPFQPRNPKTFRPWMVDKDTPLTIMLLGRRSAIAQDFLERIQERLDARPPGAPPVSPDENRAINAELLAHLTLSWNFTVLDGKPFPCTRENALIFWNDRRFERVLEDGLLFIKDDGHFLVDPATLRSTGQSEPSA